jgi:hypothetical protein
MCSTGAAGSDSIGEFWRESTRSEWGWNHPVNSSEHDHLRDRVVPTLWHADGVQVYKDHEYHVFSWSGATNWGCDVYDQMNFIAIVDEWRLADETYNEMVEYIAWNLRVMFSGLHPHADHKGKPFPEGSLRAGRAARGEWLAGTCAEDAWHAHFAGWYPIRMLWGALWQSLHQLMFHGCRWWVSATWAPGWGQKAA